MVGMLKCSGMVYTPHQCWYSDRKFPLLGERPKSAQMCLTLLNAGGGSRSPPYHINVVPRKMLKERVADFFLLFLNM